LCIDLKGSTRLSEQLSGEDYSKIIALFSREMAQVVSGFGGYVLKFVGDGIVAYFPEPNFIGMNDNAVDCAITMKKIIKNGINKVLVEKNLPTIQSRIGLDSGEAMVKTIGDISSKNHKDLIGLTVNLAAKIQSQANENQIVIGDTTARNLHVMWRKNFKEHNPPEWNYKISENKKYQLHVFDIPETLL